MAWLTIVVLNAVAFENRSYQWKKRNSIIPGATLPSYNATQEGYYRVIVTNTLIGCSKTALRAKVVTVNSPIAKISPFGRWDPRHFVRAEMWSYWQIRVLG